MSSKTFEVAIYNSEVREAVENGERHRHFKDDWADTHYIEVRAGSETEARSKIDSRYPAAKGFVVVQVSPVD